tara:strand:- start:17774 stop:17980 length:207 start_codon:yes stop_codon:yes gene_type:complete
MHDNKILGTTDWTYYEFILNVPKKTSLIAFGALLEGNGEVWFDNLKFEIIPDNPNEPRIETHLFDFEK